MEQPLREIKSAVDQILNVKSLIRKKKLPQAVEKRELFISIINSIERLISRQELLHADFSSDMSTYDEPFFNTIDSLIVLYFGTEGAELIAYYLWDRLNPDGSINPIVAEDKEEIILEDAGSLWDLLVAVNPDYDR